jgi:AraC-like DNA-binding protein
MHDLVTVAGCSARSLHYGFRQHRGIGPMRYLRDYRLARSRADLLAAGRHHRAVTEIALDNGFTHLSKFAAAYRARYGETPSQTRKRCVGD